MKSGSAIFAIAMGLMMLGTWVFLFLTDQYPQAASLPIETGYLLVAEGLTAAALVAGGYGLLSRRPWAMSLLLVALGELLYCTVRFAGKLVQGGSLAGLGFFTAVGRAGIAFATCLIASVVLQRNRLPS
jgi:hypothetical protein